MVKSIIKEIIIVLLLLLAIILALGVFFYDYIPTNKTIPTVGTYSTSETIQTELNDKIAKEETVLVTYEITSNDLKTYEKTKDYTKGKANPFSTYQPVTGTGEGAENGGSSTKSSINSGTSTDGTKGSTFYGNTGTK